MSRVPIVTLLMLVIVAEHQVNSIVGTIGDIQLVANTANDALAFVNGELPLENFIMGSTGHALGVITDKVDEIANSIKNMEAGNERRMNHILTTLINRLPLESKVETGLNELHHLLVRIDDLYDNFDYYRKDLESFAKSTIMGFINSVTSPRQGDLPEVLNKMHRLMRPGRSGSYRKPLPELLREKDELLSFGELCGTRSSPQQRLYELYQTVLVSEARSFLMTIFSYEMLTYYKNVSYAGEVRMASSEFVKRAQGYLIVTKEAMKDSSRNVDLCDPDQYIRGENFVELEKTIQMFIAAERVVSMESSRQCRGGCERIKYSGVRTGETCDRDMGWCPLLSCNGQVSDCIGAGSTKVCELPSTSLRRYEWVQDENNIYGDSSSCSGRLGNPEDYTSGIDRCDVCICTCSEFRGESPANRTINLRPQLSNIQADMVVTGVRFIQSDRMIQIQIQEGHLISSDQVNASTEHWVEPERFIYDPTGAYGGYRVGIFALLRNEGKKWMKHRRDFMFITDSMRTILLDDLEGRPGYVVTGVKLALEYDDDRVGSRSPLQLKIHMTKFDAKSGTLCKDGGCSEWISQENINRPGLTRNNREHVVLSNPDDPTKMKGHVQVTSSHKSINFNTSDRIKDAGQSTIPFFDGQPATLSRSIPLSGISLIHRGAPGSGGFLAFRLSTLDLSEYMNAELQPNAAASG